MGQLQIALPDELVDAYKEYAYQQGVPLDTVIQDVLRRASPPREEDWLDEYFRIADEAPAGSSGKRWQREELYDV